MKRLLASACLFGLLSSGCESERPAGRCVGVNGQKDPTLRYEYSTQNIILGIIFIETVVAPVLVAMDELECPVGRLR